MVQKKGMVSLGVEEATIVAKVAAKVADGDLVATLKPGVEETEEYQTLLTNLREVQKEYGIEYLYTLYTDGTNVYYGIDTDDSELQQKVGAPFEKTYDELEKAFSGVGDIEKEAHSNKSIAGQLNDEVNKFKL